MSETTNLKLFKHDNPSTNTNEFNVDTALNQNWDKIDNFVGTVNGKILEIQNKDTEQDEKISSMQSEIEVIQEKDNVQDTKLAELQAENERLRKDINGLPSGQATAETIYLTDSAEMRFKKFGIGGNSAQNGEPTPEAPIEVKSCGDNINYFDEELELGSIDNTTGENAENNSTIRSKNHIAVLSNQELTISNDKQYSNYIYVYGSKSTFYIFSLFFIFSYKLLF